MSAAKPAHIPHRLTTTGPQHHSRRLRLRAEQAAIIARIQNGVGSPLTRPQDVSDDTSALDQLCSSVNDLEGNIAACSGDYEQDFKLAG